MNEKGLGGLERKWWKFIMWVSGTGVVIGILGGLFWTIFYSDYFANLSLIIPLRIEYQNLYFQIEGFFIPKIRVYPPYDPIYTIFPIYFENQSYYYKFIGKFQRFDEGKKLIYLTGFDGKTYVFDIDNNWADLNNSSEPQTPLKKFNQNIISVGDAAYSQNSIIEIHWDDVRTLHTIKQIHDQNYLVPVNSNSVNLFLLSKFD